jgi:hypothetical protein
MVDFIKCPFCGEDDFDLIGLKTHLTNGWCDVFNATEIWERRGYERRLAKWDGKFKEVK